MIGKKIQMMATNTDTDVAPVIICRTLRQVDALVAERLFGAIWGKGHVSQSLKLFPADHEMTLFSRVDALVNLDGANLTDSWDYFLPRYTTWAMLGEVVAKCESSGYWVSMEGACGLGMNPDKPDAALHPMGSTEESGYATAPTIPVALCLAALAAFGCQVQLELGGEL